MLYDATILYLSCNDKLTNTLNIFWFIGDWRAILETLRITEQREMWGDEEFYKSK